MTDAVSTPKVVRFGTYEVDLRSGELRKNGLKVRLTGQPFQILVILLERPGELVTREEVQKRLWPGGTFVDFDRGLNAAVNRVREALGDSAENPRFVETLPRRGYRFIGQVEGSPPASSTESQPAVNGLRNGIAGRSWKIGIAAGSVILLTAFSLLFPTIARRFLRQSEPQLLEAVPLTALPGQEISPSFSPDGSQVAFGWNGENNGAGFDLSFLVRSASWWHPGHARGSGIPYHVRYASVQLRFASVTVPSSISHGENVLISAGEKTACIYQSHWHR